MVLIYFVPLCVLSVGLNIAFIATALSPSIKVLLCVTLRCGYNWPPCETLRPCERQLLSLL